MKRIAAVLIMALAMVGVVAVPASAAINGCDRTGYWTARPDGNDLIYRPNFEGSSAFMTPELRAGGCRHVYVKNYGVWNSLDGVLRCIHGKVTTYNEDGTIRVNGSFETFYTLLEVRDLRPTIDNQRKYRVYVRSCNPNWRTRNDHVGIEVFAQ